MLPTRNNCNLLPPLLLLLLLVAGGAGAGEPEPLLSSAKDIKLESRLKVLAQRVVSDVLVREFYSNRQRRGWIEIRNMNEEEEEALEPSVSYFAEGDADLRLVRVVHAFGSALSCAPASTEDLMDDLFGRELRELGRLSGAHWLASSAELPLHLVGAGRLMLLAERQRKQLELMPDVGSLIRNHKTSRYRLELAANSSLLGATRLFAYYGANSQHWPASELPLRMWTVLASGLELVVDYALVEPVEVEGSLEGERDGLDLWALPAGAGCSRALEPSRLLAGKEAPRVLSFRAELVEQPASERQQVAGRFFVAYDGLAGAARRDAAVSSGYGHFYSLSIYEFWRNLKFNVRQQPGRSNRCVAGPFARDPKSQPFEPLLPFDSMVELGGAYVRSVETLALELAEAKLPELLFPSVLYLDAAGGQQLASQALPAGDVARLDQLEAANLSMVYYFAVQEAGEEPRLASRRGRRLGPLMRIDLLQRGRLQSRLEVYEFAWRLADAPNGDRSEQLFSLNDKCAQEDEVGRQGHRLALELAASEPAAELLAGAGERNLALGRALAAATQLAPSLLHDLQSAAQLGPDGQLLVRLTAGLSYQERRLWRPRVVGRGLFMALDFEAAKLSSLHDCAWEATHAAQERNEHLLFTFCLGRCVIDAGAQLSSAAESNGSRRAEDYVSSLFTLSSRDGLPCTVLGLEPVAPAKPSGGRQLWRRVFAELRASTLSVALAGRPEPLRLQVRRLEVSDERQLGFASNDSIAGLALDAAQAKLVRPPAPLAAELAPQMSLDLCHAACLANLSCSSYSLCSSGRQLECLIGEQNFREPQLLAQLGAKLAERGRRRLAGSLELELAGRPLSLRLDGRCRLFHRRSLDLFAPAGRGPALLRDQFVVGVAGEEQCAEKCVRKNVGFFRRAAKLRLAKLSRQLEEEPNRLELDEQSLEELEADLSGWCHSFKYLALDGSTQLEQLSSVIDGAKLEQAGLCVLSRSQASASKRLSTRAPADATSEQLSLGKTARAQVQVYELQYCRLYERRFGVRLLDSQQLINASDGGAQAANRQARLSQPDAEGCARICFAQLAQVKPCKSFEFVESNLTESYCVFNSMSLEEAQRRPATRRLVQTGAVWHYEPREKLTLEAAVLAHARRRLLRLRPPDAQVAAAWAAWLLLGLALLSGLALVLALDRRGYLGRLLGSQPAEIGHLRLEGVATAADDAN